MDLATIPVPIMAANETPKEMNPPLATMLSKAGVRNTPIADAAVSPMDAPK